MSTAPQKVVVLKAADRARIPREMLDRDFLVELRRGLLQQLKVIEKQLNIQRRCPQCGIDIR